MKANLLALLITLLITHLSLSARIVQVGSESSPTFVDINESFRVIFFVRSGGYGGSLYWKYPSASGDGNASAILISTGYYSPIPVNTPIIIKGTGWLYVRDATATVEILPTSEMQKYFPGGGGSSSSSSASGEQKNVTVIPENTPSNVQITLEQSTDLVNWSVVQPGSFAPSTTKRFFRIRSEQE